MRGRQRGPLHSLLTYPLCRHTGGTSGGGQAELRRQLGALPAQLFVLLVLHVKIVVRVEGGGAVVRAAILGEYLRHGGRGDDTLQ